MHALLLALAMPVRPRVRECAFTMAIYSPHKEFLRENLNFYTLPPPFLLSVARLLLLTYLPSISSFIINLSTSFRLAGEHPATRHRHER